MPNMRFISPILAGCTAVAFASSAYAWSDEGHRVIGEVAYAMLREDQPKLADKFDAIAYTDAVLYREFPTTTRNHKPSKKICNAKSPGDVATWPDCVKHTGPYQSTANAHFDDIPLSLDLKAFPTSEPDWCRAKAHVCTSNRLPYYIKQLKTSSSPSARAEALAFVVHLVGDSHQPLHAANNEDVGGNNVHVGGLDRIPGEKSTTNELHAYWDLDLVYYAVGDLDAAVPAVKTSARAVDPKLVQLGIGDWLVESHSLARAAYTGLGIGNATGPATVSTVPSDYQTHQSKVVAGQLALGAARLEKVLIDALQDAL